VQIAAKIATDFDVGSALNNTGANTLLRQPNEVTAITKKRKRSANKLIKSGPHEIENVSPPMHENGMQQRELRG